MGKLSIGSIVFDGKQTCSQVVDSKLYRDSRLHSDLLYILHHSHQYRQMFQMQQLYDHLTESNFQFPKFIELKFYCPTKSNFTPFEHCLPQKMSQFHKDLEKERKIIRNFSILCFLTYVCCYMFIEMMYEPLSLVQTVYDCQIPTRHLTISEKIQFINIWDTPLTLQNV